MNILLLCDRVPDTASDGLLLRVLALARELSSCHSIDVLCLQARPEAKVVVSGIFRRVWIAAPGAPRPPPGPLGPLFGWSPDALYVPSPEVAMLLDRVIDPADYDVVWDAGAVLLTQLPPRWCAVPVVADLVDDMVLTFQRAIRAEPRWLDKLRNWKYAHVFGRFERETMRRAAHCVVVSNEDADSFARVSPLVPVSVVSNGVDTDHFAPDGTVSQPGHLVFEGTMAFPPNEQAAQYLVNQIMPRIWKVRPQTTVALVGRAPGPAVLALAGERVSVTGAVPDVRRHVLQAEVFVCPLVSGAGIKNKVLQAWALERAVVATSMSIGGLQARDGIDLLVRDGTQVFADAVLSLLDNPCRRAALGRAGRDAAVNRFAWSAMASQFDVVLQKAAMTSMRSAASRR